MARVARSARGEAVDFDLIQIRQQLAEAPPPIEVANRRQYIDSKESGKPIGDALLRPVGVSDTSGADEFEHPEMEA
jgi:hypothetical protein